MTNQELNAKLEEFRKGFRRLPQATQEERFHQLMCRVAHEAVIDYVGETPEGSKLGLPKYLFNKSVIIKDLENPHLSALSNGVTVGVAMRLKTNAEQIKKNVQNMSKDCDLIKVPVYGKAEFR
jgi:hypothetical protein